MVSVRSESFVPVSSLMFAENIMIFFLTRTKVETAINMWNKAYSYWQLVVIQSIVLIKTQD